MENNERLTSVQSRIEEEIQINSRMNAIEKDKIAHLESQFSKMAKLVEQNNAEFIEVQSVSCIETRQFSVFICTVYPRHSIYSDRYLYEFILGLQTLPKFGKDDAKRY